MTTTVIINEVKEVLNSSTLSELTYIHLKSLAIFKIYETFLWIGWVDKFLRDKDIYPNNSIRNGRKFKILPNKSEIYGVNGLQITRDKATSNGICFNDVISQNY